MLPLGFEMDLPLARVQWGDLPGDNPAALSFQEIRTLDILCLAFFQLGKQLSTSAVKSSRDRRCPGVRYRSWSLRVIAAFFSFSVCRCETRGWDVNRCSILSCFQCPKQQDEINDLIWARWGFFWGACCGESVKKGEEKKGEIVLWIPSWKVFIETGPYAFWCSKVDGDICRKGEIEGTERLRLKALLLSLATR